ncbi:MULTISPECIES: AAA family ATPase [Micrococcaceae]|uniref:AAA family ATPase n=1 Tax=Micrococcaceae TaxID=1268 RepID=UPI002226FD25|nr:AAA family ATPase [Arthrobacter sp. VKM Ac-2550]MCW2133413.1 AAA domain-containing protein [Arthrobacter sp. VKM Ac-2550]MCY0975545.1 AAA family ATPase [Paenarthrobacter ureafaciens]
MIDTRPPTLLLTGEYRRFCEFADAVRHDRYIGLCYGPPGVGKTLSARRYAHWDAAETYLARMRRLPGSGFLAHIPPAGLIDSRTVLWTVPVMIPHSADPDGPRHCHPADRRRAGPTGQHRTALDCAKPTPLYQRGVQAAALCRP